ncbi:MAG: hypothetical protein N2663_05505, partial [Chlorobi bacterium]|nr:hypothetical protein [Chlorobiota bacterium]
CTSGGGTMRYWAIVVATAVVMAAHARSLWNDSLTRVGAAANIGAALHYAAFGSLPGIQSCCSSYGNRWNPTWGVAAAAERQLGIIGNWPSAFHLRIGIENMSGTLERQEFIANVIVGDRLLPGVSQYRLDATLWALALSPSFRLETHHRFGIEFGTRLDWIFVKRYTQREHLMSPASGAVFENRLRTRNESSGAIPTAATVGAALQASVTYTLPLDSTWQLRPELRWQLALTPIADVPWRIHRITAGVALLRSLNRQPLAPSPQQPPPPVTPPSPAFNVTVDILGSRRGGNDTVFVEVPARAIVHRTMVMPVIFFAPHSSTLDSVSIVQLSRIIEAARAHGTRLRLAPSSAPDEADSVRHARFLTVLQALHAAHIAVSDTPAQHPIPRGRTPLLADELRAVWLESWQPLLMERSDTLAIADPALSALITARLEPPITGGHIEGLFEQDGQQRAFAVRPNGQILIQLSPARLLQRQASHFRWSAAVNTDSATIAQRRGNGIIVPAVTVRSTRWVGNSSNEEIMLMRCEFDSTSPAQLDSAVVQLVRNAITRGQTVTLIGSTDSLGTSSYNRTLAQRRIEAALGLLNLPISSVRTEIRIGNTAADPGIYGRIAGRGVFVRIEPQ